MKVNDRIRQVRKENGLTLEKFGERIGIKRASLSQIETGRTNPSDQTIKSICREFRIREEWLRDGEGEKDAAAPLFSLDEYVRQRGASDLELELIKLYLDLPPDTRAAVVEHFRAGLTRLAVPEEERIRQEARARAEAYYEELVAEKNPTGESSASGASSGANPA